MTSLVTGGESTTTERLSLGSSRRSWFPATMHPLLVLNSVACIYFAGSPVNGHAACRTEQDVVDLGELCLVGEVGQ